jgi:hypothetical protein
LVSELGKQLFCCFNHLDIKNSLKNSFKIVKIIVFWFQKVDTGSEVSIPVVVGNGAVTGSS